jgi:hypothetical protein
MSAVGRTPEPSHGPVAQLVERPPRKREVVGSIPTWSTVTSVMLIRGPLSRARADGGEISLEEWPAFRLAPIV